MKKNLFTIAAGVAFVSAVSCSVEEKNLAPETDLRVPMEFTAGIWTKTQLNPDHSVVWSEGDVISIFDGEYNNDFTINGEGGAASATFTGKALPDAAAYYALYPHSADAKLIDNVISSTLPSEQTVTAEATFATMVNPSVAVAAENSLTFKNIASILQVNVSNLAEGQTVTGISAKADKSLAGAYTVDPSASEPAAVASGSENTGVSLAGEITDLNGDNHYTYSMVVLPGSYNDLTVTVTYSDGSKSTFTASSAVDMPVSDGRTISIDASQAEAPAEKNLYEKFMDGEDITIGGKNYNKSQFTEDQIKHITGEVNISSSNKGQILFVEPDAEILTFSNQTNLVLVGNDPDNKTTLTINGSKLLVPVSGEESRLILSNLVIEPASGFSGYMFGVNTEYSSAGAFGEFVLDNCDITMTNSAFYSISGERYLDKFVMQDCNVKVPDGSGNRFILHMGNFVNVYSEIRFLNNIFYSEGAGAISFRLVSGNTNSQTEVRSLIVENNTFVNVAHTSSAMIFALTYGDVDITKNLIYISQDNIPNQSSMNILRALNNPDGYPDAPSCTDNILYSNTNVAELTYNMFYNSTYVPESGELVPPVLLDTDPFEGGDLATFTPAQAYAEYGAQR